MVNFWDFHNHVLFCVYCLIINAWIVAYRFIVWNFSESMLYVSSPGILYLRNQRLLFVCFSTCEISCKSVCVKYPDQTYHQFFKKQRIFRNNYSDARCLNPSSGEVLSVHVHSCLAEKWFIFREKFPARFFRIYAAERYHLPVWFWYK